MAASCEIINPAEKIPSYIQIETIDLQTQSAEGKNTQKITDAWVYIDDQPMGCYELPARFPTLYEGEHKITIKAGIKLNGIASTRSIYPFYDGYIVYHDINKDSTLKLKPLVKYFSGISFLLLEDFEKAGVLFDKTSDTVVNIQTKSSDLSDINDLYFGEAVMNQNLRSFEIASINQYTYDFSNPIFIEIDYQCSVPINVGLLIPTYSGNLKYPCVTINRCTSWNKMYINLTGVFKDIGASNGVCIYKLYFNAIKPDGETEAYVRLDNIKVVQ